LPIFPPEEHSVGLCNTGDVADGVEIGVVELDHWESIPAELFGDELEIYSLQQRNNLPQLSSNNVSETPKFNWRSNSGQCCEWIVERIGCRLLRDDINPSTGFQGRAWQTESWGGRRWGVIGNCRGPKSCIRG
jgi:hypothetical protein